jgi:hypothetical protein
MLNSIPFNQVKKSNISFFLKQQGENWVTDRSYGIFFLAPTIPQTYIKFSQKTWKDLTPQNIATPMDN